MQSNINVKATLPVRNQMAYWRTSPLCQGLMASPASFVPHARKLKVPSTTCRSNQAIGLEKQANTI